MNLHAPNRLMGRQPWQWNIEAHRSIQRRAVANRTCELITHLAPWYTPSGWWTRPLKTGRKIPKVDIFFTNPQHIAKHWIWELQQDVSWCLTPSVARRRPKMPSGAVQGSTRRRRCRPNVNHRGRAMPGKKICLWNSSMMSRCLDFYGVFLDLILLFSWSVFVLLCLCVCVYVHLKDIWGIAVRVEGGVGRVFIWMWFEKIFDFGKQRIGDADCRSAFSSTRVAWGWR